MTGTRSALVKRSKQWWFDSQKVIAAVHKAERRVQSRQGALIRGIARRSMRKRRGPSRPGRPPHVHRGMLKDLLFFGWDPATRTTVVGPAKFRRGIVPALLEKGGTTQRKRGKKLLTVHIAARPYMGPALAAAKPNLAESWRDAVVRTL